jgi:DNA-binding beta-propeller fold protein YncE
VRCRRVLCVGLSVVVAGSVAGCLATSRPVASTGTLTLPAGSVVRSRACPNVAAQAPELSHVHTAMAPIAGNPFGVVTTRDGHWSFVSTGAQVLVMSNIGFAPKLVRMISLPAPSAAGEVLTNDGRYLLVAAGSGAVVVSVARAEQGKAHPVLGVLSAPDAASNADAESAIEVVLSRDDRFAFVADEYADRIAVFDMHAALTDGLRSSGFVGSISLGQLVVGMAVSPDGRSLYATSELAAGATLRTGYGTLSVIDVRRATTTPSRAVVRTIPAGCGAVRVVVSPDGDTVWVTARESNMLLGFSAAKLVTDPRHARIAAVRVGEAPVGLILIDHGRRIAVADSNRFNTPGAESGLSIIDTNAALAGKPPLLGVVATGQFPREFSLEPDGSTLLVTNFASGQLEAVATADLP